ncbi:MAG: D-glycero-beta-D-manno-heptose-7-phosphate kinase [Candidatus Muirbacterium halophilum]|nr:D-glycero-beta-D-manno-heptose-7-phosphate kinase [Candidatus Muirbacterium halophilum]MCK9474847.1 D-glycero-beta-D-manno-heptose-7-phosphate kinase [Candidatus Muirbacterium halophilum]
MKSVDFNKIEKILENFCNKTILVFGDLMIDEFIFTDVKRISPEAPVPVAEVKSKLYKLGGASNVANNIVALGGKAYLCGVTGNDGFGRLFVEEADNLNINSDMVIKDNSRPTTVKTRILAHNQQIARIDNEKRNFINKDICSKIIDNIQKNIDKFDGVIFSDYAKGVMEESVVRKLINIFKDKKIPTACDPKVNNINLIKGIDYIKPNIREAGILAGLEIETEKQLFDIGYRLQKELECKALIITRGSEGITIFSDDKDFTVPTVAKKVYDVTGAGDTTIAAFMMSLLAGGSLRECTIVANTAAGIVVGEVGTAVTNIIQIKKYLTEILEEK